MKTQTRILALCLAVMLLVLALPLGASAETKAQGTSDTRYTKNKVVSVLFDNSGSMKTDGGTVYRWEYAKYALQTLMTTLGSGDTLVITPMNRIKNGATSFDEVTETSEGVVVNLSAENREQEINRVLTETFLAVAPTYGGTPQDAIKVALNQLTERGMKKTDEISANEKSENEYFLVVLTDGAFDGCSGTSDEMTKINKAATFFTGQGGVVNIDEYAFLQTLYIGFDVKALDLNRAPALQNKANFTAYKAPDTASIGEIMRDVANKITGRYPLAAQVDGKTVRISLSDVTFGLRTVTLMATNTNARYKSATYGGVGVGVTQNAQFGGFVATSDIQMAGGFTATLKRAGGEPFSGGEIVIELTEAPGKDAVISVLLEPAIRLEPVLRASVGGAELDSAAINSELQEGDDLYVSYRLLEEGSNRVLTESDVGSVAASVSYNTRAYAVDSPIPLIEGKGEIGISVSMMNGKYNLYTSVPCVVLKFSDYFRVVPGTVSIKNTTLYEVPFTLYYDNMPVSSLSSFSIDATVSAKDGPHSAYQVQKNADGTFTVLLNVAGCEYGTYTINISVYDADGNFRPATVPIGYFPSGLDLVSTGQTTLSKTLFGIKDNTEPFTFALTAQETEIPFNNALVDYTLTVNGQDFTAKTTVNGNVLTFLPNESTLGDLAKQTGTLNVKLTVTFRGAVTETREATATLTLTPTVYEIIPLPVSGTVDKFALGNNQTSLYFRVLRDGKPLPAGMLQDAIQNGEIAVSDFAFIFPVNTELSEVEQGGEPVIRVRFAGGHIAPLRGLVTSMFLGFKNDLTASVTYQGVSAESTAPLAPSGPVPYIWRILLILYLIQLLIVFFTLPAFNDAVTRVPQGTLVKVDLKEGRKSGGKTKCEVDSISVKRKVTLADTLEPLRLLPFIGLLPKYWEKRLKLTGRMELFCEGNSLVLVCKSKGTFTELPEGFSDWANKSAQAKSMDDGLFKRARVERVDNQTEETKTEPLTESSGAVIDDALYVFVKKRKTRR